MSYAKHIGQLIGVMAVALTLLMYYQNKREKVIYYKLIIDILWVSHFVLIGNQTAFLTTFIAIFREIVFNKRGQKWADNRIWLILFSVLFTAASFVTWKDIYSIMPSICSVLTTIALWTKNADRIKLTILPASIGMLFYNLHVCSYAGIVNEIFTISMIYYSIWMVFLERKEKI